jgi:hypothetical protein
MKCVACERLAVPTGTAAAAVVAATPSDDPSREARRFARLETLDDTALRAAFEELVVAGVYAILERTAVVLRVSAAGGRHLAVVCAIAGDEATGNDATGDEATGDEATGNEAKADGRAPDAARAAETRAGLAIAPTILGTAGADEDARLALATLLEEETRRRPVFHGTCGDGTTYSGFAAEAPEPILAAATALLADAARHATVATPAPTRLAIVFAGAAIGIPHGLAVGVGPASS